MKKSTLLCFILLLSLPFYAQVYTLGTGTNVNTTVTALTTTYETGLTTAYSGKRSITAYHKPITTAAPKHSTSAAPIVPFKPQKSNWHPTLQPTNSISR